MKPTYLTCTPLQCGLVVHSTNVIIEKLMYRRLNQESIRTVSLHGRAATGLRKKCVDCGKLTRTIGHYSSFTFYGLKSQSLMFVADLGMKSWLFPSI